MFALLPASPQPIWVWCRAERNGLQSPCSANVQGCISPVRLANAGAAPAHLLVIQASGRQKVPDHSFKLGTSTPGVLLWCMFARLWVTVACTCTSLRGCRLQAAVTQLQEWIPADRLCSHPPILPVSRVIILFAFVHFISPASFGFVISRRMSATSAMHWQCALACLIMRTLPSHLVLHCVCLFVILNAAALHCLDQSFSGRIVRAFFRTRLESRSRVALSPSSYPGTSVRASLAQKFPCNFATYCVQAHHPTILNAQRSTLNVLTSALSDMLLP